MSKPDLIIGIDPGISGAIAVIDVKNDIVEVFDVPTVKVEVSGRKKTTRKKSEYDKISMSNLLSQFSKRKVIVVMERVHSMRGQGVTSMFNFGRGVGLWEGIFAAHGWEPEFVTPQCWKKEYGDRLFKNMDKPEILKNIKTSEYNRAPISERKKYDEAEKEFNSNKRLAKDAAKDEARALAVEFYPRLADSFKRKKDSDRAEALLIAEMKRREIYEQG